MVKVCSTAGTDSFEATSRHPLMPCKLQRVHNPEMAGFEEWWLPEAGILGGGVCILWGLIARYEHGEGGAAASGS